MTDTDAASPLSQRIADCLQRLNRSERDVSIEAFDSPSTLRSLRHGHSPRIETINKLAPVLGVSSAWLAFGEGDPEAIELPRAANDGARPRASHAPAVRLVGEVAAGTWRDVDTGSDEPAYREGSIPADPDYPVDAQFAVQVRGQSINRVAADGAILTCVDISHREVRYQPRHGDLVIAERRRNGGAEIERTAKRYRVQGNQAQLWPDSDHPKHVDPIDLGTSDDDETVRVAVIGLVTMIHQRIPHDVTR